MIIARVEGKKIIISEAAYNLAFLTLYEAKRLLEDLKRAIKELE